MRSGISPQLKGEIPNEIDFKSRDNGSSDHTLKVAGSNKHGGSRNNKGGEVFNYRMKTLNPGARRDQLLKPAQSQVINPLTTTVNAGIEVMDDQSDRKS